MTGGRWTTVTTDGGQCIHPPEIAGQDVRRGSACSEWSFNNAGGGVLVCPLECRTSVILPVGYCANRLKFHRLSDVREDVRVNVVRLWVGQSYPTLYLSRFGIRSEKGLKELQVEIELLEEERHSEAGPEEKAMP